jgi:hypothetical protein
MGNPWSKRFVPAHRKPRDRLKGSQLAPLAKGPVKCGGCGHAPGLHNPDPGFCDMPSCECDGYEEVAG